MTYIRPPAVAGAFYPADPATLARDIQGYLDDVETVAPTAHDSTHLRPPKAIIVPHAGYVYSGPIAAAAYAKLAPFKDRIKRVVLLGPCHRVAVLGVALSSADSFATPLGNVPIDHGLDAGLLAFPQVQVFDATHEQEHSLEVQLPFLQSVLGDFKVLPMVVGDASPSEVADVLQTVLGGPETLIVISSDLSHYLDYDTARTLDLQTCLAIETLDANAIGDAQACGRMPVKGVLELAKRRGMSVETLDLRNSGDTAGPRGEVVGYGAWAFWERTS